MLYEYNKNMKTNNKNMKTNNKNMKTNNKNDTNNNIYVLIYIVSYDKKK
jgi:hypothetical protein